jgi:hypothetical protein
VDMVISLEVLEKGISSNISCLTSSYGGNEVTGLKLEMSQVTDIAEKRN